MAASMADAAIIEVFIGRSPVGWLKRLSLRPRPVPLFGAIGLEASPGNVHPDGPAGKYRVCIVSIAKVHETGWRGTRIADLSSSASRGRCPAVRSENPGRR